MDCIRAVKRNHPSIDFGYVGDIAHIEEDAFKMLIENEIIPVSCAITHDGKGQLLNTNADTIAAEISKALSKSYQVHLWFGFEKLGVLTDVNDASTLVRHLTKEKYHSMLENGQIQDGMKPKLQNCIKALEAGVSSVYICNVDGLLNIPHPAGTKITLS